MRRASLIIVVTLILTGCTHTQLRRSTISQEGTLSELQVIQVLDNIATFHDNQDALPFFAVSSTGSAQISDNANALGGPTWDAAGFANGGFSLGANRTITEGWGLAPVVDPHKLQLMRCAYQLLLGDSGSHCEDCFSDLAAFFGPDFNPDCQVPCGWYCVGRRCDVPKDACYVGRHCNTYAWVSPEGMDGLARFTLTIMSIAVTSAYEPPTHTEVEKVYDDQGRLIREITREVSDADDSTASASVSKGNAPPAPRSAIPRRQSTIPLVPPSIQFFPGSRR